MSSTLLSGANGERAVASESNRIKLQDNLRGAADAMETPNDLMVRLVNTVSSPISNAPAVTS